MGHKLLMSLVLVSVLGGVAGGGYLYYEGQQQPPRYLLAAVERGSIATTVNATGIVNAVTTVQVGSQVSGIIQKLFVDFNSPVKAGEIIAQLDPAPLATKVAQARALGKIVRRLLKKAPLAIDDQPVCHVLPDGSAFQEGEGLGPDGADCWVDLETFDCAFTS